MARLWTSGFESQHWHSEGLSAQSAGTLTYDTTNVRYAGTRASAKYDSTSTPALIYHTLTQATTNGRFYYFRANIRLSSAAGESNVPILSLQTAAHAAILQVRINASNQLQLYNSTGSATIGSASGALSATTWYRVEVGVSIVGSGSANCYAELKLDGITVATSSVLSLGTVAIGEVLMGWVTAAAASHQIWLDDCCLNDDQTGGGLTTWAGEGKVWLMLPTSDNARGAGWLDDNAGTTNLWSALDNTPPVGVTHAPSTMAATAQIYNVTSGTGQNMDVNMQTYTAVGVPANDTIVLEQMAVEAGLAVGTTRAVNAYIVSNPAESAPSTFSITAAIAGTYPSNWMYQKRTLLYAPSVTRGTVPVARVSKEVNNVAAVDFCFAGITIESQTPTVALAVTIPGSGTLTPTMSLATALSSTIAGVGTLAPTLTTNQLTLYGSNVAATTITTAGKLSTGTVGAQATATMSGGASGTGYIEMRQDGAFSGTDAPQGSIPAPTGHGYLWDVTTLEGNTISAANWGGALAIANATSAVTGATLTVRFYSYNATVYTHLFDITSASFTIGTTRTAVTLPSTAESSYAFVTGDKLYFDVWAWAAWPGFTDTIWYLSNSGTAGVAGDCEIDAPSYSTTSSGVALSVTIPGAGTLAPTLALSTVLASTMAGVGTLSPTLSASLALPATTLAGVGVLTGTFSAKVPLTSTLAGVGTLTATLAAKTALTSTIAGVGTLTATLSTSSTLALSATISGAGTMTSTLSVGTTYYVSTAGNNTNGTSWANAWNELNQIVWTGINPGDAILIDGGSSGMTYNTTLTIGKSGSAGLPITIQCARDASHNGKVTIFGGRTSLLPYCTQVSYTATYSGNQLSYAINCDGYNYITIDGMAWHNLYIYGCTQHGVRFNNATNINFRNCELYDNGSIGGSAGNWSPGTGSNSIDLRSTPNTSVVTTNITFYGIDAHDSGEDAFQPQAVSHVTLSYCWLHNTRNNPSNTSLPFNQCNHNDGMQIWTGAACSYLAWDHCILGPGNENDFIIGNGIVNMDHVSVSNCLFFPGTAHDIVIGGAADTTNSTLDHVTAWTLNGDCLSMTGTGNGVTNSIFYGGGFNYNGTSSTNDCYSTVNPITGITTDPNFVTNISGYPGGGTDSAPTGYPSIAVAATVDLTPQAAGAIGLGSSITSVAQFLTLVSGNVALAVTISGVGTFTPAAFTESTALTATLSGSGTLAPTLAANLALAPVTIAGTGTLTATLTEATALTVTVSGSGTLAAPFTLKTALSTTIAGVGTLTATLSTGGALIVTIPGVGTLTPTLSANLTLASVTLSGVGILTATAQLSTALSTTIAGVGTVSVSAWTLTTALTSTFAGVGTLSGTLTLGNTVNLSATIAGVGTFTVAAPTFKTALSATLSGTGTLTPSLSANMTLTGGTFAGTGTLAAILARSVPLVASLNGASTLSGVMTVGVALFVTCAGASTISGVITVPILSFLSTICVTRDMQATCVTRDMQATAKTRS